MTGSPENWDPTRAPRNTRLMCWTSGWQFMLRDELGQWRSMHGRPRNAPKYWQHPLPAPVSPEGGV